MTEVPKIVYDRLRAASKPTAQDRAHPDADLLASFAEQTLSVPERGSVLSHLALCGECREVVALALPAEIEAARVAAPLEADPTPMIPVKSRRGWLTTDKFAWPGLRWAALAAGVAVAVSLLVMHPRKLNRAMLPSVQQQATTTAQSKPDTQIAASATDQSASIGRANGTTNFALTKNGAAQAEPALTGKELKTGQASAPSDQSANGILIANNVIANSVTSNVLANNRKGAAHRKESVRSGKLQAAPQTAPRLADNQTMSGHSTNEVIEASEESSGLSFEPSPDGSQAKNQAPAVEKAKPVPLQVEAESTPAQETPTSMPGARSVPMQPRNTLKMAFPMNQALTPDVTWAVKAGVLQRSLDNGQTWQNALHADHPLTCYASHDNDVWAGGEAGTIYHSADGGLTWVKVRPSINAHQLSADVIRLDLREYDSAGKVRALPEIVVTASNNELWSSIDGGNTWNKN